MKDPEQVVYVTVNKESERQNLTAILGIAAKLLARVFQSVNKGPKMHFAAAIHQMHSRRRSIRMQAVLALVIIGSNKSSEKHQEMHGHQKSCRPAKFRGCLHDCTLIRGSNTYSRMSAMKFPATRNHVLNTTD